MKFLTYWKLRTMLPVLLACTAMILGSWVWRDNLNRAYSSVEEKGKEVLFARLVTTQKILEEFRLIGKADEIQITLENIVALPEFSSVALLGPDNQSIASAGTTTWKENLLLGLPSHYDEMLHRVQTTQKPDVYLSNDRNSIHGYVAVTFQVGAKTQPTETMGVLFLQMDLLGPKQTAKSVVNRQFILTAWVIGGLTLLLGIVLHVSLTQRIARFVDITRRFEAGDFQARTGENGYDEISHLGKAFDKMATKISEDKFQLQEKEQRLRTILDMLVEAIITIDSKGIIESINQAGTRIFGYEPDEVIGKNVSVLMPSPYKEEHDSYIANYLETGRGRIIGRGREVIGKRKDGTTFPCYLSVSDAHIQHKRIFTGMISDLTERKRLEIAHIQSERLATIGVMSAKLAHEIRNPLSSVLLNLDLIQDEFNTLEKSDHAATQEAKTLLTSIDSQIRRIHRVTEDYLQFAKVPKLNREQINLNDVLDRGLTHMHPFFEAAQVRIETDFDKNTPLIAADEGPFWQAVLNIIKNAVDAMPDGGTLILKTEKTDTEITLKISDSGNGIQEKDKANILKPFFSTKPNGTGLGLPLAQQIILEHGGSIEFNSYIGQGTTFSIHIPTLS